MYMYMYSDRRLCDAINCWGTCAIAKGVRFEIPVEVLALVLHFEARLTNKPVAAVVRCCGVTTEQVDRM